MTTLETSVPFELMAQEMEASLRRHVMDAWFPHCLDVERGGFHSNFDRRWRPGRPTDRMLEFQARQTRVAARLAIAYPAEDRWHEYALHGFRALRDMWDTRHGGWYWMVGNDGQPTAGATKHSHSGGYTVQACALVFRATGERAALELGEEGLDWHDRFAHDEEFGGFHNWLTREGEVIRRREQTPEGAGRFDPMGHDVGLKDINTHGDFFEALLDLTAVSDSGRARELLIEFGRISLDKTTTPGGEVHYAFHPNWMPQPGPEWYGYGFQAAQRFLESAHLLPELPGLEARGRVIVDHTLRIARRRDGGFAYAGPGGAPRSMEGTNMRVSARMWWVQFEALRALALFLTNDPGNQTYERLLRAQWQFLQRNLLDETYGGVYFQPTADLGRWSRPWMPIGRWAFRKGSNWKDASHETACLLGAITALRGTGINTFEPLTR